MYSYYCVLINTRINISTTFLDLSLYSVFCLEPRFNSHPVDTVYGYLVITATSSPPPPPPPPSFPRKKRSLCSHFLLIKTLQSIHVIARCNTARVFWTVAHRINGSSMYVFLRRIIKAAAIRKTNSALSHYNEDQYISFQVLTGGTGKTS